MDKELIPPSRQLAFVVDVPAVHRGGRSDDFPGVRVDHCVVVVDDANDVHGMIVGVADVAARIVANRLVVKPGNFSSGLEGGFVSEAKEGCVHDGYRVRAWSWD